MDYRDKNGRLIGTTSNTCDGKVVVKVNGITKGSYDPKTNYTRDSNGRTVGHGNLLSSLLSK